MDIINSIISGVIAGVIASAAFIFYLSRNKPALKLSKFIARRTKNGQKEFIFKIANTLPRSCINVKVNAAIVKATNVEGGVNNCHENLNLVNSYLFRLSRYDKQDLQGYYAWRFVTTADLDDIWNSEEDTIEFQVMATDSYTGFSKVFSQIFRLKRNSIKDGAHKFGLEMDVT
ncbi:MAG: hypothetical protein HRT35_06190 [Algicola sp.]|nr:hypothetical protein [Algicola sp.]